MLDICYSMQGCNKFVTKDIKSVKNEYKILINYDFGGRMEFKRVKLLSGMLSAAALAGIAGAPVMANEIPEEKFPLAKTLENDQADHNEEGSIAQFLNGQANEVVADTDGLVEQGSELNTVAEDLQIPLAQNVIDNRKAEASDLYLEAAKAYNRTVLPELTVALQPGNVYTGILGEKHEADPRANTETAPAVQTLASEKKIVVASPNVYLNIHAEPSMSSEVLGKMYSNDLAIELHKEDDRWTRIRSGNIVGYVMNEYLVEGDEAQALSEIVSTQVATVDKKSEKEVYQEASDTAKVVTEAKAGDQYEVTESEDGWLGILTEDGEGYIPSSEVTLSMAYPVAETARQEEDRVSTSNVKERADHEQRKADKADAVVELAQSRAEVASGEDEETATAVVEVALRAADAAAAQADVARVAVSQAGEESGQAVIEFATQYIGNPYVWGGSSLTHGADCSGFVMAVYGNFGFRLPHYDVSDRSVGSPVASLEEARAGDIICYNGHVALYMGDGMIVHAQDERHGITTSRANFMHIVCIRRLFT